MDWANENYVRAYTRDTDEWLLLSWEARSLWMLLMRKFDRAGILNAKYGARSIAAVTGMPLEVVERALPELLDDGCLVPYSHGFIAPNFLEAQETPQSDKQRKRAERERRQAEAMLNVTKPDASVTNRDEPSRSVTETSGPVTPSHMESHGVTLSSAPLCSATLSSAPLKKNARAPRTPSGPHQQAIAEFTGYYERTHRGSKPTWNAKTGKLMATLVGTQGLPEILTRIAELEQRPPTWPPAPWDFPTFVQHFDKLAPKSGGQNATVGRYEPELGKRVGGEVLL
jgi:hypothetical protein